MTVCRHAFDADADHRAACDACRDLDAIVARHDRVFAAIEAPAPRAELRDRSFLDGIYERATRDLSDDLSDRVADELAKPHRAPREVDERLLESPALRGLEPTRAPGLLGPRLAAEIRSASDQRRRAHRRARAVRGLAAAAVVTLAVWVARSGSTDPVIDSEEISIVRLQADAPFAPSFSGSEIVRRIATGPTEARGHDGR